jgi:hypothetical protein
MISLIITKDFNNESKVKVSIFTSPDPQTLPMPPLKWLKNN